MRQGGGVQHPTDDPKSLREMVISSIRALNFSLVGCLSAILLSCAVSKGTGELPPGAWDIYRMNADGSVPVRLTHNRALDSSPIWSPDGNRIAFVSDRDGNAEIYVMNTDGSSQIRVTKNEAVDTEPTWSPDSTRIAFVRHFPNDPEPFENSEIVVISVDGSDESRLTSNHLRDESPVWSPDSTQIAFLRGDGDMLLFVGYGSNESEELYIVNADGSALMRLTTNPGSHQEPTWSPSGRFIAFSKATSDQSATGIFLIRPDGSELTGLTKGREGDEAPTWSPNSQRLLFIRWLDDDDSEIFRVDVDGSPVVRLTHNPGPDSSPSWSPDGTQFVFQGAE